MHTFERSEYASVLQMRRGDEMSRLAVQISTAGMEICRLLAVASVFSGQHPLPAAELAGILTAALLVSRLLASVRRRLFADAAVHLLGAAVSLYLMLSAVVGYSETGSDAMQFLVPAFWGFCGLLFWYRGARVGYTDSSYSTTVSRFDIGIGIIIFTAFITAAADAVPDQLAKIAGVYLFFGIISLFTARSANADREFSSSLASVRVLGMILLTVLLTAAGIYLILPSVSDTAEHVFISLRDSTVPLRLWLTNLLVRILSFGRMRADTAVGSGRDGVLESQQYTGAAADHPAGDIILWIIGGLAAFFLCYVIFIGLRALYQFLARRSSPDHGFPLRELAAEYLRRLHMVFRRLADLLNRKYSPGAAAFRNFRRWGRRTGVRKRKSETAAEYGARIQQQIPGTEQSVEVIVSLVHREWYQGRVLSPDELRELKAAGRTLISPVFYPARLRRRLRLNPRR